MSTAPYGILFYGYLQPVDEDGDPVPAYVENEDADDNETESVWDVYPNEFEGCSIEISGYDGAIRHFVTIREAFHRVEWAETERLESAALVAQPTWNERLRNAVAEWKLNVDVDAEEPAWYLVCLYF